MTRHLLGQAFAVGALAALGLLAPLVWSAPESGRSDLDKALDQARRGELKDVEEGLIARLRKDDPEASRIVQALVEGYLQTYRYRSAEECLAAWAWLYRKQNDPGALFLLGLVRERAERDGWGNQSWGNAPGSPTPGAKAEASDRPGRDLLWYVNSGPTTAVAAYQRVLELDPKHDEARLHLAQILLKSTKADEALPHFQKLLERRPKDAEVVVELAQCNVQLGKLDEAAKLLDGLLAQDPKYVPALTERGKVALQTGKVEEGEALLRKALAGDPSDYPAGYALAQALLQLGKQAEAQQQLKRLERLQQDLKHLDELAARMDDTPHDPALDYEIGTLLLRNGRDKDGVRWLSYALLEDPHHRPSHRALAEYCERTGNKEAAERHRREAEPK
jgi:tetratricopeptide (TPR) repeat protein